MKEDYASHVGRQIGRYRRDALRNGAIAGKYSYIVSASSACPASNLNRFAPKRREDCHIALRLTTATGRSASPFGRAFSQTARELAVPGGRTVSKKSH